MNILFDYQAFTMQKYGGISRYFYELLKGLDAQENGKALLGVNYTENGYLVNDNNLSGYRSISLKNFRGKVRLLNYINQMSTYRYLNNSYDIFHPTYYNPYFLKKINNKPFVLTVYDMIHEKFPEQFPKQDKTSENKKLLVEKANKIIAISESTKIDLIDILKVNPEKIEVVHLANSLILGSSDGHILKALPKRYVLFVGTRNTYKNFNRFARAVAELIKQDHDLYVYCVGGGMFSETEIGFLNSLGVKDRFIQAYVNDTDLALVYKNALAFIFPSCYEGFGIPLLEAMYSGCPVITSNKSSLPEVAGQAACYFDPYDEKEMRQRMEEVVYNEDMRQDLIDKGYKKDNMFSWERTIQNTKEVYRSLL